MHKSSVSWVALNATSYGTCILDSGHMDRMSDGHKQSDHTHQESHTGVPPEWQRQCGH